MPTEEKTGEPAIEKNTVTPGGAENETGIEPAERKKRKTEAVVLQDEPQEDHGYLFILLAVLIIGGGIWYYLKK